MALNEWTEYLKPGNNIAIGARIKHDSPDVANRRVRVYYEFFYYRLGGYNWYENPYTTGKATVDGVVKYHNTSQLVNLYHQVRHTVHSGNVWVSYGSSTTKSMPYKFEHDGSRVPPIDASIIISGNYTLPTIGRSPAPTPTPTPTKYGRLSSVPATLRVGQAYTVSVNSSSSSYSQTLTLSIDGEYNEVGARIGSGSITFTVPDSSRFGTKEYLRGLLMLHTFSGSTYLSGDSYSRNVYPKPKPPTSSGVSIKDGSGSASGVFASDKQVLMGLANLTATVSGATAVAPGASINQYEVILKNSSGATRMTATSSSSAVKLGTPNYSLSGSEVLDAHVRVRDTNGTWSSVKKTASVLQIHGYSVPSGKGSVVRNGSSAEVSFEWSASSLKETSSAEEKNSVSVTVQSRPANSSSWSGKHTHTGGASLVGRSSVVLNGYETVQGYDFRIGVTDGFTTTYINIGSIGTEAVPLDLSKGGAGVGKIHSGSGAHLQVGTGGISSEGPFVLDSHMVLSKHINGRVDIRGYAGDSPLIVRGIDGTDGSTGEPDGDLYLNHISKGQVYIAGTNKAWHQGNDGSGSGLDADLLDGKHASDIISEAINGVKIPTIPPIPKAYSPTWGGSGNNRWIKFPSGHQICWGSTTTTGSSASITYPRAFTATPMITVTGEYESFSPSTTVSTASKSAATLFVVDGRNGGLWGGSYTSGRTATLRYIAVGMG